MAVNPDDFFSNVPSDVVADRIKFHRETLVGKYGFDAQRDFMRLSELTEATAKALPGSGVANFIIGCLVFLWLVFVIGKTFESQRDKIDELRSRVEQLESK